MISFPFANFGGHDAGGGGGGGYTAPYQVFTGGGAVHAWGILKLNSGHATPVARFQCYANTEGAYLEGDISLDGNRITTSSVVTNLQDTTNSEFFSDATLATALSTARAETSNGCSWGLNASDVIVVDTLYSQGDTGVHATQATFAKCPLLWNSSGWVVDSAGNLCLDFDGSNDILSIALGVNGTNGIIHEGTMGIAVELPATQPSLNRYLYGETKNVTLFLAGLGTYLNAGSGPGGRRPYLAHHNNDQIYSALCYPNADVLSSMSWFVSKAPFDGTSVMEMFHEGADTTEIYDPDSTAQVSPQASTSTTHWHIGAQREGISYGDMKFAGLVVSDDIESDADCKAILMP